MSEAMTVVVGSIGLYRLLLALTQGRGKYRQRRREHPAMAKPLEGIRIIEITNVMSGPYAGMLLADMGADVIKVEALRGDMARAFPPLVNGESVSFSALNRNKRSLAVNLKNP